MKLFLLLIIVGLLAWFLEPEQLFVPILFILPFALGLLLKKC